jgi:hypothetical protein
MLGGLGALNKVGVAVAQSLAPSSASLNLDFTLGSLDSRITFTRASTATFFDSAGVLTSAAVNAPRFDYNPSTLAPQGLLIEEQRTNLLVQSENFATTWVAANLSVSADATTAPSGATTADKLIATAVSGEHIADNSFTAVSGTTYTFSAFVKAAGLTDIGLRFTVAAFWTGSISPQVRFNLLDQTMSVITGTPASYSITPVGNGWYRVSMSVVCIANGTPSARIQLMSGASNNFTGNGVDGCFVWGAQTEAGAFATSYIPTTTTALTRNADVASMTGTNFSSWYNAVEGTFVAQYLPSAVAASNAGQCVIHVSNGTATEQLQLIKRANVDASTRYRVDAGGVNSAFLNLGTFTATQTKAAITYKVDDFVGIKSGGSLVTDTSGGVPAPNKMDIGTELSGLSSINGYIQRISYYPTRLADSTLQALTA